MERKYTGPEESEASLSSGPVYFLSITIYCVASASLFTNSSLNQMRFRLSTRKPSWGWLLGVGVLYSENEPVPLSGKEPKMLWFESSNQTNPLLSTLIPDV